MPYHLFVILCLQFVFFSTFNSLYKVVTLLRSAQFLVGFARFLISKPHKVFFGHIHVHVYASSI